MKTASLNPNSSSYQTGEKAFQKIDNSAAVARTLTAAESGTLFAVDMSTVDNNVALTLPTASDAIAGCSYDFCFTVNCDDDADFSITTGANGTDIYGYVVAGAANSTVDDVDGLSKITVDGSVSSNRVPGRIDFETAEGAADKIIGALEGISGSVARQAGTFVGEAISLAGIGDPVRFTLKRFGTAINPRNEAFYNSPQQRTFSYTFDFWPRSKDEALAVEQIITMFKYNSAPGLTSGDGMFVNPNYFKISYMNYGKENPHLHKIGACFCTGVDVDYSPDGQFTTFENGQPVHTKLTVNFLEDRIVTKKDIEAGA